ncbi:uncharacterized protein LOC121056031 [Oryza brachyantha]|uniref:uncharacterized protein LOC121056031 n=1 Tax=Oryza brachyantha TaxID=4533 RepID=UPI001ADC0859|nr:uncharacterized protein LOC121056031 [Oryza brachyantha]
MADCYALEMDDLHRRWLPPEILDDIGFADAAASPAPAAIEGLAAHLAGLLGSGRRKAPPPASAAAAAPASYHYHHHHLHRATVCGLERQQVLVAYGGAAAAASAWPFPPYSSPAAQWQVAAGLVNGGGALDHRRRHGSPPAKLRRGGTGVFLPRAEMYHAKAPPPPPAAATRPSSRDGKATKDRPVEPGHGEDRSPATETASPPEPTTMQLRPSAAAVALQHACPELALPQEWTY